MIIRYAHGQILEAVLLSRTETTMRVAIENCEDIQEFNWINGIWVSEDCEPVQVEFSWSRQRTAPEVTETDCICSHELAARLIHMLYAGDEDAALSRAPLVRDFPLSALHQVV